MILFLGRYGTYTSPELNQAVLLPMKSKYKYFLFHTLYLQQLTLKFS